MQFPPQFLPLYFGNFIQPQSTVSSLIYYVFYTFIQRLYQSQKDFKMQIFVEGASTTSYDVTPSSTVQELKQMIAADGVAVDDQVLTFNGPLSEGTLSDNGVSPLSTISLGLRLRGGKVHGSLARAGKVKGQTPKVDAQEKKKPKTGRAKRRQQYNQRFVNVVASFGPRRGPNSNQS